MSSEASERRPEPPAVVTPTGIDVRTRVAGYGVLDLIVAGSAILISCVSLFIATQQSRTMEKTLAASSWPLLQFKSGNTDENRKLSITMSVENQGVGPAIVERFRMVYAGKEYSNPYAFMRDCCGYALPKSGPAKMEAGAPLSQPVEGKVIRGGESLDFFTMDLAPANASTWHQLDRARFKMKFDTCYCSVLGDCWQSDLASLKQARVEQCPAAQGNQ